MGQALPKLSLILGGAKSGKSRYAETLIERAGGGVYLATAQAFDGEMTARIRDHQDRRNPALWQTEEEPLALADALLRLQHTQKPILVDCLTLWLSNLLLAQKEPEAEFAALEAALNLLTRPVVMVSNEVGFGIVPDNALARVFRDHAGCLHQRIAARADRVELVVAGYPVTVKETPVS